MFPKETKAHSNLLLDNISISMVFSVSLVDFTVLFIAKVYR